MSMAQIGVFGKNPQKGKIAKKVSRAPDLLNTLEMTGVMNTPNSSAEGGAP
jgi:hypothetical protein